MMESSDPIPIKGFLETSFVDWPGKVCSVVFLPGCNFRCPFCHNAPLILNPSRLETIPLSYVLGRLEKFVQWVDGVCITGGEPTTHTNLADLIQQFRNHNFAIKLDTNGSNPALIEALLRKGMLDCIAMDIKAPLVETSYSRLSGCTPDLDAIRTCIEIIRSSPIEAIFRMTVVPELITENDIYEITRHLAPDHSLVLQPFSPENTLDPSLQTLKPWPQKTLALVQQRAKETGNSMATIIWTDRSELQESLVPQNRSL